MKPNWSICFGCKWLDRPESEDERADFLWCRKAEGSNPIQLMGKQWYNGHREVNDKFIVPPECPFILEHAVQ